MNKPEIEKEPKCNEKVRQAMLTSARQIPLKIRVEKYEYPYISFDSCEYYNQKPLITKKLIKNIETEYLKKILKMTGHSIESNTDIILHTIYEEVNRRRKDEEIDNRTIINLLCN